VGGARDEYINSRSNKNEDTKGTSVIECLQKELEPEVYALSDSANLVT